jgi:hypothetical protein
MAAAAPCGRPTHPYVWLSAISVRYFVAGSVTQDFGDADDGLQARSRIHVALMNL